LVRDVVLLGIGGLDGDDDGLLRCLGERANFGIFNRADAEMMLKAKYDTAMTDQTIIEAAPSREAERQELR
jgi:hypothetical protein